MKFIFFLWYMLFDFQKVHRRDRLYSYLATMGLGTPSRRGRLSQNILNNEAVKTFIRRENIILWTSKVSNIISSSFHTRTFIVWCFWNFCEACKWRVLARFFGKWYSKICSLLYYNFFTPNLDFQQYQTIRISNKYISIICTIIVVYI